eukprot:gene12623-biopygen7952
MSFNFIQRCGEQARTKLLSVTRRYPVGAGIHFVLMHVPVELRPRAGVDRGGRGGGLPDDHPTSGGGGKKLGQRPPDRPHPLFSTQHTY